MTDKALTGLTCKYMTPCGVGIANEKHKTKLTKSQEGLPHTEGVLQPGQLYSLVYALRLRVAMAAQPDQQISFLKQYSWLYQTHLTEFFTHNQWELVPPAWRHPLCSLDHQELALLPSCQLIKDSWPPDLKAFVHSARNLWYGFA